MSRTAHHGRRHRTVRCHDCADTGCEWCRPKRLTVEAKCPDDGLEVQRRELDPGDLLAPIEWECGCDCAWCLAWDEDGPSHFGGAEPLRVPLLEALR